MPPAEANAVGLIAHRDQSAAAVLREGSGGVRPMNQGARTTAEPSRWEKVERGIREKSFPVRSNVGWSAMCNVAMSRNP